MEHRAGVAYPQGMVRHSPYQSVGSQHRRSLLPVPTEREQIRFSYSQTESNETILQTAVEIILTEPEHRPGLLVRINPSITKDGLEQIGRATREWLDHNARYRIRAIARRCFEGDSDPRFIAPEWTTTGEIERMLALLAETEFPDTTLAVSYAMAQAHDAAYTCTTLTPNPPKR